MAETPLVSLKRLLPIWAAVIPAEMWITWPWHTLRTILLSIHVAGCVALLRHGMADLPADLPEFGGRNLSGAPEIMNDAGSGGLVNTGMHARMRHPIYLAHLCNLAGLSIGSGLAVNFVLLAISLVVTYPLMIVLEERELEHRFGASYREYNNSVPLLPVPFAHPNLKGVRQ